MHTLCELFILILIYNYIDLVHSDMSSPNHPVIILADSDIEDAFSSTDTPTSPLSPSYTSTFTYHSHLLGDNSHPFETLAPPEPDLEETTRYDTETFEIWETALAFPIPPFSFPFSIPTCQELDDTLWIILRSQTQQEHQQIPQEWFGIYTISDMIDAQLQILLQDLSHPYDATTIPT
jgi:hypothetical protein